MDQLAKAYEWDISARIADQNLNPNNIKSDVTEITQGVIFDQGGVKVTAFDVDHGELLKPAFGYRIDFAGNSVVL
jgi:ribonuclease Z